MYKVITTSSPKFLIPKTDHRYQLQVAHLYLMQKIKDSPPIHDYIKTHLAKTTSWSYLEYGYLYPADPSLSSLQASKSVQAIMTDVLNIFKVICAPLNAFKANIASRVPESKDNPKKTEALFQTVKSYCHFKDAILFFYQAYSDYFHASKLIKGYDSDPEISFHRFSTQAAELIATTTQEIQISILPVIAQQVAKRYPTLKPQEVQGRVNICVDQLFQNTYPNSEAAQKDDAGESDDAIKTVSCPKFAATTCIGLRTHQEDRWVASPDIPALYAVFDGHGGSAGSDFLATWTIKNLKAAYADFLTKVPTPAQGEIEAFLKTKFGEAVAQFKEIQARDSFKGGSTLSMLLETPHRQWAFIQLGDSTGIMLKPTSSDQKIAIKLAPVDTPGNTKEIARIKQAGGEIRYELGILTAHDTGLKTAIIGRVHGPGITRSINMTAAFGDEYLFEKPPTIQFWDQEPGSCIILHTDGLDVINAKEIEELHRTSTDTDQFAKKLTQTALKKGSADNIACIVIPT